jgi:hypothetical protein
MEGERHTSLMVKASPLLAAPTLSLSCVARVSISLSSPGDLPAHHERSTESELGRLTLEDLLVHRAGSEKAVDDLLWERKGRSVPSSEEGQSETYALLLLSFTMDTVGAGQRSARGSCGQWGEQHSPSHGLKVDRGVPVQVDEHETRGADDCEGKTSASALGNNDVKLELTVQPGSTALAREEEDDCGDESGQLVLADPSRSE